MQLTEEMTFELFVINQATLLMQSVFAAKVCRMYLQYLHMVAFKPLHLIVAPVQEIFLCPIPHVSINYVGTAPSLL